MRDKKVREKKRVSGKGRIALIVAVPLVVGLFLSFAIGNLASCYEQRTTEVVIHKSPLVWRTDDRGDYLLSELSASGTYELVEAIETEGEIETITATWEFKGEVTLEVSANDGLNYTPVVYGVPLTSGFVQGDKIKWRVSLGEDSELTEIKIAYTDISGAMGTFGTPELSGFKYRKPIYITNTSAEELFNYQMRIEVAEAENRTPLIANRVVYCEENIEADFEDIRFTAQDGETLLPYYLENITGESPDRIGTFWVKVPQIPAQGLTVYIYYGNLEAESLSSTQEVFDFYEDFDKDKLNPATWEIQTYLGGDYGLENSLLKLDAAKVISKKYQIKDGIIEYRAKAEATGGELRAIIREKDDTNLTQLVYSSTYPGAEHSIAIGNIVKANAANPIALGVFYDYRVIARGQEITFERYEIASPAFGGLAMTEALLKASVSYEDTGGLTKGYVGFETGGVGNGDRIAYYDWLRARKYAVLEPTVEATGPEEEVNLAEFLETTVADDGDVIIVHSPESTVHSGQYTIPRISTTCDINAITPSLRATPSTSLRVNSGSEEISIDISTDGGLTWKTGCISGRAYTAPLDFTPGSNLKLRANLSTSDISTTPELEQIKIDYSIAPIVNSTNIYSSGATGEGGVYKLGDVIVVEWDNSSTGDNNPDIISVSCNFAALGGESTAKMFDDGPLGGHADKKAGDNIYTTQYELPEDIHITTNIYVTAGNKCGLTTRDGHILSVDTRPELAEELIEAEEEAKAKEKVSDLKKRFTIKFGEDEAEIGDFETEDFRPYAKMKRWGEECFLSVEIPDTHIPAADKAVEEKIGKKIEWDSPRLGGRFYKKPRREITKKGIRGKERKFVINENDGLEFEVVLKQRPASNVISLPIKTKGLKFYYQGPLTRREINKGAVRPDEVVGSYAVYHEKKKDGKYKTGKAFHIYRPKIIDKNGDWTWGELNIDEVQGVLTVTINQAWLNSAAYPVTVDPEFGYMSIGSSSIPLENVSRGSIFTAELMTPDNITAYLENTDTDASHTAKYAIYSANDSALVAETAEVTIPVGGKDWYKGLYISQPNLSAQEYALVGRGDTQNILMYFDEGAPNQGVSQTMNYTADWPETASFSYDNNMYSIYDDVTWYDATWQYRMPITLTPATPLADYQVKVELTSANFDYSNAKANGEDIRFAGSDGTTLQDYWIEKWNDGGNSAIWVEVKTSGTSTIYMYYGNAAAAAASNGDATFEFFDGFDDGSVDLSKWTYDLGTAVESDGTITLNADEMYGNFNGVPGYIVEAYAKKFNDTAYCGIGFSGWWNSSPANVGVSTISGWTYDVLTRYGTDGTGALDLNIGSWTRYKIVWIDSTHQTYYADANSVAINHPSYPDGLPSPGLSAGVAGTTMEVDWVFIRKYSSSEPVATLGTEEVRFGFLTTSINESQTDGATNQLNIGNDPFNKSGALIQNTDYTISGLPAGVTVFSFNSASSGGTTATLTLSGTPSPPLTSNATVSVVIKGAALTGGIDSESASFTIADEVVVASPSPASVWESATFSQTFTITLSNDQLTATADAVSIKAAITLGGDFNGLTIGTVTWISLSEFSIELTGSLTYSSTQNGTIGLAAAQLEDTDDAQATVTVIAGWYDATWQYRMPITLTPATPLADYQVRLELTSANFDYSKAKANGEDIRFTGSDGTTLQDYWIEKWNDGGNSAIWVEVKTSGTSTIYMYYGNDAAAAASNGDATFEFFEDFEGTTIDDAKLDYGGGTITQDDVLSIVNDTDDWDTYVYTDSTLARSSTKVFQAKLKADSGTNVMVGWYDLDAGVSYVDLVYSIYFTNGTFYVYEDSTSRGIQGTYNQGEWYDVKIELKDLGAKYYYKLSTSPTWTVLYDSIHSSETPLKLGVAHNKATYYSHTDNWLVRKYSSSEPVATLGTAVPGFLTTSINESQTDGATNQLNIGNDPFNKSGALIQNTDYTISGLPAGVTVFSFNSASSGGTTATLTLSGTPSPPLTSNATVSVVIKGAALTGGIDSESASFTIADEVVVASPSPSQVAGWQPSFDKTFTITLSNDQLTATADAVSIKAAITLGGDFNGLTIGTVTWISLSEFSIELTGSLTYSTGNATITLGDSQLEDNEAAVATTVVIDASEAEISITVNLDATPPTMDSAETTTTTTIEVTFSEDVDSVSDATSQWGVAGKTVSQVTPLNGLGDTLTITFSPAIGAGDKPNVTYTAGDIKDTVGNALATDTVTPSDGIAPTMSAETKTTTTIKVTFSEDVDSASDVTSQWGVAGNTVSEVTALDGLGDTLTITFSPAIGVDEKPDVTYTAGDIVDGEGNALATVSVASSDGIFPAVPSEPNLADADDSGSSHTDNYTNVTTDLTFSGTAEANTSVQLYDDGSAVGSPVTATGGDWSIDINLVEEEYSITATATDGSANTSSASTALLVTVDTTPNATPSDVHVKAGGTNPIDYINNDSKASVSVDVSFSANPDAGKVYVTLSDGAINVTGSEDADTTSLVTTVTGIDCTTLDNDEITVKARHIDIAGNTASFFIGTPATKDISAPTGYTVSFDQDYVNSDNEDAISFTFAGAEVAEVGTTAYNYSIDDTNAGTSPVTGSGTISTATDKITPIDVSSLDDDTLTLTVYLTDTAGNQGTDKTNTIIRDATAPTFTIAYYTDFNCTSFPFTNDYMKAGTYYIKISADESLQSEPTITIGAEGTANNVISQPTDSLSGNDYRYERTIVYDVAAVGSVPEVITIAATDTAGNTVTDAGVDGEKYTDTTAPTGDIGYDPDRPVRYTEDLEITAAFDEGMTSAPTIAINYAGTAELSATAMTIKDGDDTIWTYSATIPDGNDGTATITLAGTDIAGNALSAVDYNTFTVDNTAPDRPSGITFEAQGGAIVDNTLNDSNTNFTASATITPGQGADKAELLMWIVDEYVSFVPAITDDDISAGTDEVTFASAFSTKANMQAAFAASAPLGVELTDATGNAITNLLVNNLPITIDYVKPTVTSISVSPDPAKPLGVGGLTITIGFNEAMDNTQAPTVTYDPAGVTTGLQYCTGGGWEGDGPTYLTYEVDNDTAITAGIGDGPAAISVTAAMDVHGCTMLADTDDTFVIDTTPPLVGVEIDREYYTSTAALDETWADDDTIEGTSSDATAGINNVTVSIEGADHYWHGGNENWDASSEQWNAPTTLDDPNPGDWTYALDDTRLTAGRKYTVRAQAEDNAGNTAIDSASFVYVPILKITVGDLSTGSSSVSTEANVPVQLTITATDDLYSEAVSSYEGVADKILRFSGPRVALNTAETPATIGEMPVGDTVSVNFTNGIGTAELLAYRAETTTVDVVEDPNDPAINSFADPDYDLDLTVTPGNAVGLAWGSEVQTKVVTDAPFSRFKINVADDWGNPTSKGVAGTPQVIIKLADGTEGEHLTGNSETTNAAGEAIFKDLTCNTAGTIVIRGTSTDIPDTVSTITVKVEDTYTIKWTVYDSVDRNQLPTVTLNIYDVDSGNKILGPFEENGVFEDIRLPYKPKGYIFEFTKEGYVTSAITKVPSSPEDSIERAGEGADEGDYDNAINWTAYIMSIQEALADYRVISSFVYTEPTYYYDAAGNPTTLKSGDTLNIRLWLERRGKLIVHQDLNKLQGASVEIYDEVGKDWDPVVVRFTGVKYNEGTEAWYTPTGSDLPDDADPDNQYYDDKLIYEENENDRNGVFQRRIDDIVTISGSETWDLTAGRTYFARCKMTWGGSVDATRRIYVAGNTFTITVSEKLMEISKQIKTEIIGKLGVGPGETVASILRNEIAKKLGIDPEVVGETVTSKIIEDMESKLGVSGVGVDDVVTRILGDDSALTMALLKERVIEEHRSRILNQAAAVRLNDTMIIQYKAVSGLSPTPTIDVYDADNTRQIKEGKMEETVSDSGIYEYEVKFAWGLGEHTIICQETTSGTLDGINITVISTDLESIASDTTTTMARLMGIDTDEISRLGMSVDKITSVVARITGTMDELSAMSDKVKELSQETTDAIYSQLEVATEKLKEINEGQGIKIEKMYDLSEDQSTDVDYIRNKTLEIKALVELSQEILSREGDEPIVKTWMETGAEK